MNKDRYKHLNENSPSSVQGKPLPKLYEDKDTCCGCSACFAICPADAICMEPDKEGFLYPAVDASTCIRCYECLEVCAFKRDQKKKGFQAGQIRKKSMDWSEPKTYAVKHKDSSVRALSRSGGMFTALSDRTFKNGGIVYGCVMTENFEAIHVRASGAEERNRMRGSKYIQSAMGDVFRQVKNDLDSGYEVLFSGTSCQVAGLRAFLKKEYDNLICVDVVCSGAPSPLVWKKYLEWQKKKSHGKIYGADFRNKTDYGWRDHVESLWFENKRVDSRIFVTLFYGHMIVRPCCYKCPYKDVIHPGDMTIADYWGIEKAVPGFDDDKGVSFVLVNNDKGNRLFQDVKGALEYHATRLSDSMQPPLRGVYDAPEKREQFWTDFHEKSFDYIAKQYGGAGIRDRAIRSLRTLKKKIVSRV